ncbi:restriction endonuclease subunit S [Methylomonas sp. 2BW1-5-20]|uniref:restriction endonuclease subunit S n=1 Tax=Methylomonas sp. 2BW1-5-20 TaxID=3376686 RepID=UPI004050DC2C
MEYTQYSEMDSSEISWLQNKPRHWRIKRLKFSTDLINSKLSVQDSSLPYLGLEHIESWTGRKIDGEISNSEGLASAFVTDDVLFGKLRPYLAKVHLAQQPGLISSEALVVRAKDGLHAEFLKYYMLSRDFINIVDSSTYGSKMPRASWDFIGNLPVLLPEVEEQQAIARFLDFKAAQIDALIAKKQTLLDKLAEKRTALISHAVTKGLDPSVPLKDSGVAWLGEIPAHWKKMRIKHLLAAKKGAIKTGPFGSQLHSSEMMNSEVKVFNQKTVIEKNIFSGENYVSLEKFEELKAFEVFKKDLLVTTRGTIGRCMEVPDHAERGILHPCLMRLQLDGKLITNRFMEILIGDSGIVLEQLRLKSNATTIEVVYSDSLKEVFVPLPSLLEQKSIVFFIDEKTVQIDQQKAKIGHVIDRLKEYRSALITNAVTGKIDVRDFQIPTQSEQQESAHA